MYLQGRMRIALVVLSLDIGGQERLVLRMAQGFVERGHEVHVVTLTAAGEEHGAGGGRRGAARRGGGLPAPRPRHGAVRPAIEAAIAALPGALRPFVTLTGARRDVARVLNAFDVYASSSRAEGLPLALAEALAWRLPIVATAVGGVPDIVPPEIGLLVPHGDQRAAPRSATHGAQRSSARNQRMPSSMRSSSRRGMVPTRVSRSSLFSVAICEALATESMGRPVSLRGKGVFPVAPPRALLLVRTQTTTVSIRLAFTSSRWMTSAG